MMPRYPLLVAFVVLSLSQAWGQCSTTQANSCVCRTPGQTVCDLLPDLTISWVGLESYSNGPSEYPQGDGSNAGRLRVTGSTPNIGYGPLEVRTVSQSGLRHFVCGTDTFTVSGGQTNFNCPNGQEPKQIIFQQVYRKNGNQMLKNERMSGSMTYHSAHSHYHVDDWTTMTLRLQQPGVADPRQWPVVATGAKVGFCLMDFGKCSTSNYHGHCRTSQEYQGGTALNSDSNFPNIGMYGNYQCQTNVQGISVGRTDVYSKSLDMMWINMMDGLCNGNYWIVAEVDPNDVFVEENDENNWTAIPYTLTQQRPAGSGGSASIQAPEGLRIAPGGSIPLVATAGHSYQWSNGATTRTINVTQPGNYSVTVTGPCGQLISGLVNVTALPALAAPIGQGAEVVGPASAQLSASGQGAEIVWYATPSGGSALATGGVFNTPVLEETTSYYASTRTVHSGLSDMAAKTNLSGPQNSATAKQALIFDAYQPFEIVSVKVYATGNGTRHFVLVDNVGNLIDERYVYLPSGTQRVDLNFHVPAGTDHRITAFDDNTEIIRQLHRDNEGVSYPYAIGTMGSITGSTAGAGFYYYLYDWEVRTPDVVVESPRTEVTATVTNGVALDLRMWLDGPYDTGSGLMRDDLRTNGLVPVAEPYSALGFTQVGGGGETLTPALLQVVGDGAVVDWVLVELRDAGTPATIVATRSGLLLRDGRVVSPEGSTLRIPAPSGSYHVAVRHRNHLGCMTTVPVSLAATPVLIDLGSSATITWGQEARKANGARMTLWSGNVLLDDQLKYTGMENDRDPILATVGGVVPTNTIQGYLATDVTLDGTVKYTGQGNDRDPILSNIGGVVPTNIRLEQLP
ncbi:MAG: hypothetical protein KIT10_06180 [Flavobacteriales bacterium]|nr:hypothetical protein [Flavobacteriales bacterium]